jgi:hypothetical protein
MALDAREASHPYRETQQKFTSVKLWTRSSPDASKWARNFGIQVNYFNDTRCHNDPQLAVILAYLINSLLTRRTEVRDRRVV